MTRAALMRIGTLLLAVFVLSVGTSLHALTHQVKKGETLSSIAHKYSVTTGAIMRSNQLANANRIRVGQKLNIPKPITSFFNYTIKRGDSLSSIAIRNKVKLSELSRLNGIRNANKIRVGQVIKVPGKGPSGSQAPIKLPWSTRVALNKISVRAGWKYIVIHHSATVSDNAQNMDRVHREERGMENGLAYHFVIGNGHGMGNGEIFIGDRWRRQINGGHLKSAKKNEISIGICLVGNFEKSYPTQQQLDALEGLIRYLMKRTNVHPSGLTTHTLIHPNHTLCPGKNFPTDSFLSKFE